MERYLVGPVISKLLVFEEGKRDTLFGRSVGQNLDATL